MDSLLFSYNQTVRNQMIHKRLQLTNNDYALYSTKIQTSLIEKQAFCEAKTVAVYLPIKQEVDTNMIISACQLAKKHVVVPVIVDNELKMVKFQGPLDQNKFGVLEPTQIEVVNKDEIDLIICPMVAFNHLNRLGYGKGYYDRYLMDYHGIVQGIAFSFQEARFDVQSHDKAMDEVITN